MTAFGGLQDREVIPEDVQAWSRHTTGPFQAHLLPGDHFFVNTGRPDLLRLVMFELGSARADPGAAAGTRPA